MTKPYKLNFLLQKSLKKYNIIDFLSCRNVITVLPGHMLPNVTLRNAFHIIWSNDRQCITL